MISDIKKLIAKNYGRNAVIKVDSGRNKYEIYECIILNTYPNIFTVKIKNQIKSFSYSDILSKSVILKIVG